MVSHLNKYITTQIILGVFGGLAQVWEGKPRSRGKLV